MNSTQTIESNLASVRRRLAAACQAAGRDPGSVELLAVTKKRPLEALEELHRLGCGDFGENRVQDLRERAPQLPGDLRWHLIGHLQTNKAKYLPGLVHTVHSLDRVDVAEALQKAFEKQPRVAPLNVYLQFNIAGEEQKYGASQAEALEFLGQVLQMDRLRVCGLMCMAPYAEDPELSRPVFRALRELRDRLEEESGADLPGLSMGMTGDFEVAIQEGATVVRVGTALFE